MTVLNTENNDYTLIFDVKQSIFSNNIICIFNIKDMLGRDIININTTREDMGNFIDNILTFIELEEDILYKLGDYIITLNISEDNNKFKINNIPKDYIDIPFDYYITFSKYNNESIIPIIKFKITYTLENITTCMLNEYFDTYIE